MSKKKKVLRHLHRDLLRIITFIAGCAVVLMCIDEDPGWINVIVVAIAGAWLFLFFHVNDDYFSKRYL